MKSQAPPQDSFKEGKDTGSSGVLPGVLCEISGSLAAPVVHKTLLCWGKRLFRKRLGWRKRGDGFICYSEP